MADLNEHDRVVINSGALKGTIWHFRKVIPGTGYYQIWHPVTGRVTTVHPAILDRLDEDTTTSEQKNLFDM